jgi:hypothetical protein
MGGRVICMETLCHRNPIEKFPIDDEIFQPLFKQGNSGAKIDPETHRKSFYPTALKNGSSEFRAVSNEITRRVSTGNYKNISL